MKTQRTINSGHIFLAISMLLISSCSTIYDFPLEAYTFHDNENIRKINLSIALVISDELKKGEIYTELIGGSENIILGKLLEKNSVELARSIFSSFVVKKTKEDSFGTDVQAILMPRLVGSFRDLRKQQTSSAILEWELLDSQGKVVWVETVNGKGVSEANHAFNPIKEAETRAKKQTMLLMDDLFDKSYTAILNSPEIKSYADNR